MKKLIVTALSILTLAFVVRGYVQHPTAPGRMVHAQAFANGDALTVTRTNDGLQVAYYDMSGAEMFSQPLPLLADPEGVSVQVCGAWAQVFVGYRASVPGDLSTAYTERFVLPMPTAQGCGSSAFMPVILKDGQ